MGQKVMTKSSVAICGLARDCGQNLELVIPQVEQLGSAFESYQIVVVENDSKDNTAAILSLWSTKNHALRLIQYCYTDPIEHHQSAPLKNVAGRWFAEGRMRRMAFARNQYLEALEEKPLPDFVIVLDLDIRSFSLAGVEHSFGLMHDWDVIAANGTRYSIRHPFRRSVYWDSYAYEPIEGFWEDIQTPQQIRDHQVGIAKHLNSDKLLEARSAFGGLCIYRAKLLANHRYSVMLNDNSEVAVLCDHPTLHRSIRQLNGQLRLVIDPQLEVNYGSALLVAQQAFSRLLKKWR